MHRGRPAERSSAQNADKARFGAEKADSLQMPAAAAARGENCASAEYTDWHSYC